MKREQYINSRLAAKVEKLKKENPELHAMNTWSMGTIEETAKYELDYEFYCSNYNGGCNQIEIGDM